jgi:hypothetical protein
VLALRERGVESLPAAVRAVLEARRAAAAAARNKRRHAAEEAAAYKARLDAMESSTDQTLSR